MIIDYKKTITNNKEEDESIVVIFKDKRWDNLDSEIVLSIKEATLLSKELGNRLAEIPY